MALVSRKKPCAPPDQDSRSAPLPMADRFLRIAAQGAMASTGAGANAHLTSRRLRRHYGGATPSSRRSSTMEFHLPECPPSVLLTLPLVERWSSIYAFFKAEPGARPCRGMHKMERRFSSVVRDAPTATWLPARVASSLPICRLTAGRVPLQKFAKPLLSRVNRQLPIAGLSPLRLALVIPSVEFSATKTIFPCSCSLWTALSICS